mgnify:CR=1 FL=1
MTKSQLVEIVAKKGHLTKKAAEEAIEVFLEEVAKGVAKGQKVVISGFGTFKRSTIADKAVEPFGHKDKRQIVKKHGAVVFSAGKPLKKAVW